jgi:hypothetical protein
MTRYEMEIQLLLVTSKDAMQNGSNNFAIKQVANSMQQYLGSKESVGCLEAKARYRGWTQVEHI